MYIHVYKSIYVFQAQTQTNQPRPYTHTYLHTYISTCIHAYIYIHTHTNLAGDSTIRYTTKERKFSWSHQSSACPSCSGWTKNRDSRIQNRESVRLEVPEFRPGRETGIAEAKSGCTSTKPGIAQAKSGCTSTKPGIAEAKSGCTSTKNRDSQPVKCFQFMLYYFFREVFTSRLLQVDVKTSLKK